MIHIIIGLIVGLIMGLTGAGGALISIPLFLSLLNVTLKEATVLSLIAVMFGTSTNLIGQVSKIDLKVVLSIAIFGGIANFLSIGIKAHTPDFMIAAILTVIGAYSIWAIWQKKDSHIQDKVSNTNIVKLVLTGSFIGLITTLTGLGGGVLLVPILIKFYGKNYNDALPTSLATIFLISLSSLLIQGRNGFKLMTFQELLLIGVGAFLSFYLLKKSLKFLPGPKIVLTRQIVFTVVTLYSIVSVALNLY